MFIEDLSTFAYFARGENVRAIGWLEAGRPYSRGPVAGEFLTALKAHLSDKSYQPVLFMGGHQCSLCAEQGKSFGKGYNLLIPTPELLYVAPAMVVHYIEEHGYQPPSEFVSAVLSCPEQDSTAYSELVRPFQPCWNE